MGFRKALPCISMLHAGGRGCYATPLAPILLVSFFLIPLRGEPNSIAYRFGPGAGAYDIVPDPNNPAGIYALGGRRILKYDSTGPGAFISTAFQFVSGASVDGPAGIATISTAYSFAIDSTGSTFYIADTFGYRIRKLNLTEGQVTAIVGNGTMGTGTIDGPGTSITIGKPHGIDTRVDESGNFLIYYSDATGGRIKLYNETNGGQVTNLAGSVIGFEDGPASSAKIYSIYGLQVTNDGDTIYFCDRNADRVRKLEAVHMGAPLAQVTTVAGNGARATVDGYSAHMFFPVYLALDE
eukprot:jgi/Bigna1/78247/fgenesh1_pg.53_\